MNTEQLWGEVKQRDYEFLSVREDRRSTLSRYSMIDEHARTVIKEIEQHVKEAHERCNEAYFQAVSAR